MTETLSWLEGAGYTGAYNCQNLKGWDLCILRKLYLTLKTHAQKILIQRTRFTKHFSRAFCHISITTSLHPRTDIMYIWQMKKTKRSAICPGSHPEWAASKPWPVTRFPKGSKSPLSEGTLPARGHQPWAAGPGSPPSTRRPGLPGKSFHRACPDYSLVRKRQGGHRLRNEAAFRRVVYSPHAHYQPVSKNRTCLKMQCLTYVPRASICYVPVINGSQASPPEEHWRAVWTPVLDCYKSHSNSLIEKIIIQSSGWERTLEEVRAWGWLS